MWQRINSGGTTSFLENDPSWIAKASLQTRGLEIHKITYTTKITAWRELLHRPQALRLDLPEPIRGRNWDVVLVDGPAGYANVDCDPVHGTFHGRMQSIYAAAELVAPNGYVFVHDAARPIESAYSRAFLRPERMLFQITSDTPRGKIAMACYWFSSTEKTGFLSRAKARGLATAATLIRAKAATWKFISRDPQVIFPPRKPFLGPG